MPLKILSFNKLSQQHFSMIKTVSPDAKVNVVTANEAGPYLKDTDILLAFGQTNLAPILPLAPSLKWIHALTAGVDRFLALPEFVKSDIILTNSSGIHGIPIAETVLGAMLSFNRCLFTSYDNMKTSTWQTFRNIDEIYEKTALIVGLGNVGKVIAKRLKAMGMNVLAIKQTMISDSNVDELFTLDKLDEILPRADFIVVALPLTSKTNALFSKKQFSLMKPSAIFINVGRGELINEDDINLALRSNTIRGAMLDVFHKEPLNINSPLWTAPNLLITPHSSSISPRYMTRTIEIFCTNLALFPDVTKMKNIINKESAY